MIGIDMVMPKRCLDCPIADHEVGDDDETLYCGLMLKDVSDDGFLHRSTGCPLKAIDK